MAHIEAGPVHRANIFVGLSGRNVTPQSLLLLTLLVDVLVFGLATYPFALWASSYASGSMLQLALGLAVAGVGTMVGLWALKMYAITEITQTDLGWQRLVVAAGIPPLLLPTIILFAGSNVENVTALMFCYWVTISVALMLARLLIASLSSRCNALSGVKRRIGIIGATEICSDVVQRLARRKGECELLGIFDDGSPTWRRVTGLDIKGTVADLVELASAEHVDEVMIALPLLAGSRIAELARRFQPLPVDVTVCFDDSCLPLPIKDIQCACDVWALRVFKSPLKPEQSLAKGFEDKTIAVATITLLLPALLLIALAIKLNSPGPILFRQKRYGYRNRIFEIYKFRTMYAESTDVAGARLTERDDARITGVGRFLRKYSLDELPQLFNVLSGDMSIVGPRPHALAAAAAGVVYCNTSENYTLRQRVKPGLTGWAQVNGLRGPTDTLEDIRGRLAHDIYYIENWSILLDLKILVRTVRTIVRAPSTAF